MTFEIRLCGNNGGEHGTPCNNPVPPSLNPGRKRLYCSAQCKDAVAQRRYRGRNRGTDGEGMVQELYGQPYCVRTVTPTHQAAENRFKRHLKSCMLSDGGPCKSRVDPYDRRRLCIVHAVLREDWDQARRAAQGRTWKREVTNERGFWIDAPILIAEEQARSSS